MKKFLYSFVFFISFKAISSGIPTIDIASLTQMVNGLIIDLESQMLQYEQYTKQVQDLQNQYEQLINLKKQLELGKEHFNSIRGLREIARVFNNPMFKKQRENLPTEWQETFNLLEDVNDVALDTAYGIERSKVQARMKGFITADSLTVLGGSIERTSRAVSNISNAQSVATTTYNMAGKQMAQTSDWIAKVGETKDLKESLDLNNRMMAELLVNQNRMLQILSASVKLNASAEESMLAQKAEAKAVLSIE
ncbi:type IV secretion system protein [Thalassotalea fusca]